MSTVYTAAEIAKHKTRASAWLSIHGKVYDVTDFIDEHPGGYEVIIGECGKPDSSEAFLDVGHSEEAQSKLPAFLIGTAETGSKKTVAAAATQGPPTTSSGPGLSALLVPIALLGAYFSWRAFSTVTVSA